MVDLKQVGNILIAIGALGLSFSAGVIYTEYIHRLSNILDDDDDDEHFISLDYLAF